MALSKEALASIINKNANGLCSPAGDRMVASYSSYSNINDPDPNSYNDFDDSLYLAENSQPQTAQRPLSNTFSQKAYNNSNMPDAIKESMRTNVISVETNGDTSYLDNLPKRKQQQPPQRRQINENVTIPQQTMSNGIDYSIIKAIVNECLENKMSKMNVLNESTLNTIGISKGKIRLIDNSGKVYEAKLEYKCTMNN